MDREDLATLVALTEIEGIGDKRAVELFRAFESRDELWDTPREAFQDFHYVDANVYAQLQELPKTIDEYQERFNRYQKNGIVPIGIGDERYPAPLRQYHAPPVLYAKGNLDLLTEPAVSVSGSRDTNEAGRAWIRNVTRELAEDGYTVVSGGALGADTGAHRGALDATGATIVVLGTGINVPYPAENEDLFVDILDSNGLLLSHRSPDAEPNRYAFLNRNKTISTLSAGTIIVATDGSGGTMDQYETALEQGRQVFVPETGHAIRPSDGLNEIRAAESTVVVSSATDVEAEFTDTVSQHPDQEASENREDQTKLHEWGN